MFQITFLVNTFAKKNTMYQKSFSKRHIGITSEDQKYMLSTVKSSSMSNLVDETIPNNIRSNNDLHVGESMTEKDYLTHIEKIAKKNKLFDSFIGQGYYGTETPSVILRNVFENPVGTLHILLIKLKFLRVD